MSLRYSPWNRQHSEILWRQANGAVCVSFFGIFRCHFYGNAVWFLAGYRTPQYIESVKWKCQRSRISQSSANCLVRKSESFHWEKTCKYDTTGSDDMCNCCICMVHFLVWLNDFGVLDIKGLYVKWLAKIVVMKTSWVFDIANGVVNTLSLNEHWHKKLNRGILEVSLVLVVEM